MWKLRYEILPIEAKFAENLKENKIAVLITVYVVGAAHISDYLAETGDQLREYCLF